MIPLVDFHCHLLPGLDDGPATADEALEMCRIASGAGTSLVCATAHQNEQFGAVTPDRIRQACRLLARALRAHDIPLHPFPCAEVQVFPGLESAWSRRELLGVADRREYLLLELPHGLFLDLRDTVQSLCRAGVRPILAHAERSPELLHETGRIEELIHAGCLVQVSSGSVTDPPNRHAARALRRWLKSGLVHLIGSDGHSVLDRPPKIAEAYHRIARWAGARVADRVCSVNGLAILQGLPLRVAKPEPARSRWFAFW